MYVKNLTYGLVITKYHPNCLASQDLDGREKAILNMW